eukprot:PhF_6_TR32426/c0_g1_i2/m.48121/K09568/FKBP1; FK506-binding protein 1
MGCGASGGDKKTESKPDKKPKLTLPIPEEELIKAGYHIQTLTEGDKTNIPKKGDTVVCKYKGYTVSGTNFGASDSFSFKVGKGQVVPGWDAGIVEMSVGQKVQLSLAPKMGYDEKPMPGIPANSILLFEMELLEIKPKK